MDAVSAALQVVGAMIQETPEPARLRYAVVSANPELRERELVKMAEFAAAMAGALRDRGIPEPAASLAAETGIVVYRVTFARWIGGQAQPGLRELLLESVEELRDVLADRLKSTSALSKHGGVAVVVNAPVTGSAHYEATAPPRWPCGRAKASAARRSPLAAARWLAQALPPGHASPR
jgi:hypothetical protein